MKVVAFGVNRQTVQSVTSTHVVRSVGLSGLINSIAALLWPILAFTVLFVFRKELKRLLWRIKRGKIFGQEFELEDSLARLDKSANQAAEEVGSTPAQLPFPGAANLFLDSGLEKKILAESARSPKAALLLLASELEREVKSVVASRGLLPNRQFVTLRQGLDLIRGQELLPRHIVESLGLFEGVRNRLVHGQGADDDDTLRAIDSGTRILKTIQAIPREINIVHHPGVDMYADEDLTKRIDGVKGVILETTSADGLNKSFRIFPSARSHFEKGMRVAWEWSFERTFGPAWYRDPESGAVRQAWVSSAEFIGRDIDSI